MSERICVEKIDEKTLRINPTTCDEWVSVIIVGHGVGIKPNKLIDLHLSSLDFVLVAGFLSENSESELSIILVDDSEAHAVWVQLDLLHFNVLLWVASNFLLKDFLLCLDRVHLDVGLIGFFFRDGNGDGRILSNGNRLNLISYINFGLVHQILEYFFEGFKLWVRLQMHEIAISV